MKTIVFSGPTGAGKSSQVARHAQGEAPTVGHSLESQTTETKSYNSTIGGEAVMLWDTPGLGDSEERDQVFLNDVVEVFQKNCTGVHKFYFCMAVTEQRFNSFLSDSLSLILQLAPELKEKPSVLTVMLTKADKGSESYWANNIEAKIAELKKTILVKLGVNVNVIVAGDNNQDQFIADINSISMNVFCQTQFMKHVETLETQRKNAEKDLEVANKANEAKVQQNE